MSFRDLTTAEILSTVPHPKYTDAGCYPLLYVTDQNDVLCAACADKDVDTHSGIPVAVDVNWEDPALHCDDCGGRIESAYAEPEDEVTP